MTQCDNVTNGCEWVGELRSLDGHSAKCDFTLLPCPNKCYQAGSRLKVVQLLRKDIEKHTKEKCPRRQYECPRCKELGEYKERTTTHLNECPMKKVPCPNNQCNILIVRCNLSKHRQECLFEKVPCKYLIIGCKVEVIRKDLREHEGDSEQHLQLAIDTVHQQQITIKDQETIIAQSRGMPMKYKFTNYDQHKTVDDIIYSPAFYTSPGGYKMCICVYANGNGEGKGTHVSVFAYLMKGENDDHLPWPFTGRVTAELLNQLEDKNHRSMITIFHTNEASSRQVANEERSSNGWGQPHYIAQSDLGYNATKSCQYLKDDCLYFRFSVVAKSSLKPWLF